MIIFQLDVISNSQTSYFSRNGELQTHQANNPASIRQRPGEGHTPRPKRITDDQSMIHLEY